MKPKTESMAHHEKYQEVVTSEDVRIEVPAGPNHYQIQQRAYEIYIKRGGIHGQDLEDWLLAERELKAKYAAGERA